MTPFRKSQARTVVAGLLRSMAPHACSIESLREVVHELATDGRFWADLEGLKLPEPRRPATTSTSSVMDPLEEVAP